MEGPAASLLTYRFLAEFDRLYPVEQVGGTLGPAEAAPPHGIFLVAYFDGRPAGCGGLHRLDRDVAEVRRMYVEPWARGHGLARRLLAGLEATAGSMVCSSVRGWGRASGSPRRSVFTSPRGIAGSRLMAPTLG